MKMSEKSLNKYMILWQFCAILNKISAHLSDEDCV